MAKARSPRYPAIGLKDAVDKVRSIYEQDYQNPIPRAVAAAHMGYSSLNGKSLGVLSALVKFGLLEGRGDNTRVTDLAVQIIAHPPGAAERIEALQEAASAPELFEEIEGRYPGGRTSDQAIRSYLLTQKFIPAAADAAIRAYRETKQLVDAESKDYGQPEPDFEREDPVAVPQSPQAAPQSPAAPQVPASEPIRISIASRHVDVAARLETPEHVDELIRKLGFAKMMLTPVSEIKKPEEPEAGNDEAAN